MLKSKIHRGTVTDAHLDYEGSLSVDAALLEQAGLRVYERVLCSNLANGERFETYLIAAPRDSGAIVLNGATAHLGKVGDKLTIMSYAMVEEAQAATWTPTVILLGDQNQVLRRKQR